MRSKALRTSDRDHIWMAGPNTRISGSGDGVRIAVWNDRLPSAKALGLNVLDKLLATADEVIE